MRDQKPILGFQFCLAKLAAMLIAVTGWHYGQHPSPPSHPKEETVPKVQDAETRRMAQRLRDLAAQTKPERAPYLNDRRAEKIAGMIRDDLPLGKYMSYQRQLAVELLYAGKNWEAIEAFRKLETLHVENGLPVDHRKLRHYLALAYLRLGEQENCQEHHNVDSCLLPIRDAGVHRLQRGSRGAFELLSAQLKADPTDNRARWLLHIAAMTLGKYPAEVPPAWRIAPEVFKSGIAFPRYRDIAPSVGVDVNGLSGGSVVEDFDNDGLLDIMCSSWGFHDQVRFFRNRGDGSFEDRTQAAGLTGITGGLNMVHADYDNDGNADVLILRGAWLRSEGKWPNSLLRNHGDGQFSDVTESSGLLSFHPTQTAVWFDYNNDGHIDLFIGNESDFREKHPCELFHNNGDGTFSERAATMDLAVQGFVKGVTAGDIDNDGWTDLFISRMEQTNFLMRNNGPQMNGWSFSNVTFSAGVYQPIKSFPTWFWDYDHDGWLDLFVADYGVRDVGDVAADFLGESHAGERPRLFRNRGDGRFEDVTKATGLNRVFVAMGSNFGDLDTDGWLDFYLGTGRPDMDMLIPNRMLRNDGGQRFHDITFAGGFGHLQKGHGISFADLDNDGDQDIYAVMGGAYSGDLYPNALFENPGHGHQWITLVLEGAATNRGAIGARVKVVAAEGENRRHIFRTVGSGGSFGASPLRLEVGLGKAQTVELIEIFWPVSKRKQVFEKVAPGGFYLIRENEDRLTLLKLKSFLFQSSGTHRRH